MIRPLTGDLRAESGASSDDRRAAAPRSSPMSRSGSGDSMGFRYTGSRGGDMARSVDCYTRVMGMRVGFRMNIAETGGKIAILKSPRGSQRLELNWYPPKGVHARYRHGDELDHLAFGVRDVRGFLREHRTDVKVRIPPFREGGDWLPLLGGAGRGGGGKNARPEPAGA